MTLDEKIAAFAAATNNELFDTDLQRDGTQYGWQVDAVETHDSIGAFVEASSDYNECTWEKFGEIAGFKFVAFSSVQFRKGSPRRSLSVIDFGEVRYAIDADLTCYV